MYLCSFIAAMQVVQDRYKEAIKASVNKQKTAWGRPRTVQHYKVV